jgi:hypothetical protein
VYQRRVLRASAEQVNKRIDDALVGRVSALQTPQGVGEHASAFPAQWRIICTLDEIKQLGDARVV